MSYPPPTTADGYAIGDGSHYLYRIDEDVPVSFLAEIRGNKANDEPLREFYRYEFTAFDAIKNRLKCRVTELIDKIVEINQKARQSEYDYRHPNKFG